MNPTLGQRSPRGRIGILVRRQTALAHISVSHWRSSVPNFYPRTLPSSHYSADTSGHFTLRSPELPPTHPQSWIVLSSLSRTLPPFKLQASFLRTTQASKQTTRRSFAKFPRASITTLELHAIPLTHRTLLILLSLFLNVGDLRISSKHWWEEIPGPGLWRDNDNEIQHISPPRLRGSFKSLDIPSLDLPELIPRDRKEGVRKTAVLP